VRMEIMLPWPPRELSPNARCHWAVKGRQTKLYRTTAMVLAKHCCNPRIPEGPLYLWVTFFPPDRRRRDDDNVFAGFKAGRDGIAQALGIDDNRFRYRPYLSDKRMEGGGVRVVITDGPEEASNG